VRQPLTAQTDHSIIILPTAGRRIQAGDDRSTVQALIAKLVERLKEEFGDNLVSVVLYGSVARGDYRPDSDIDLLLVLRGAPSCSVRATGHGVPA